MALFVFEVSIVFIGIALNLVMYDIGRIKLLIAAKDAGRNAWVYGILPYISFFPGLEEPIEFMKTCKRIRKRREIIEALGKNTEIEMGSNDGDDDNNIQKCDPQQIIEGDPVFFKHLFGNKYHTNSSFTIVLFIVFILIFFVFMDMSHDIKEHSDYFNDGKKLPTKSISLDEIYPNSTIKMDKYEEIMRVSSSDKYVVKEGVKTKLISSDGMTILESGFDEIVSINSEN